MKKLFDNDQIRRWDEATIQKGMASIDLMERAAIGISEYITNRTGKETVIGVMAGPGNNGGDALAVGRLLRDKEYKSVTAYLIQPAGKILTPDCYENSIALKDYIIVEDLDACPSIDELNEYDLLIDGLFGSGLSRPLTGIWSELVQRMNSSTTPIISIDVPSGALTDIVVSNGISVFAQVVLSLQIPKRVYMFPESQRFMKDFELIDIGLDPEFHAVEACDYRYLEESDIVLKERDKFSHKGTYGHALLIAGSNGMYGAAQLCARGCLQGGVGLLTVHSGAEAMPILQATVPEAMFSSDVSEDKVTGIKDYFNYNAIACGPGLGQELSTISFVDELLDEVKSPLVLDADALNIIAKENWQNRILPGTIITPHPGEFERLYGISENNMEAVALQRSMAISSDIVIIRKGAHTSIALPDGRVYFNSTGNPYMSKGGMGDILTGLIAGLLAQGFSSEEAALTGVFNHGKAGDMALEANGGKGLSCDEFLAYFT